MQQLMKLIKPSSYVKNRYLGRSTVKLKALHSEKPGGLDKPSSHFQLLAGE